MSRLPAPELDSIADARPPRARATHRVRPIDVSKVICHREKNNAPQFLVRWRTKKDPLIPPRAVASWHDLDELWACLHLVQSYVEDLEEAIITRQPDSLQRAASASAPKKRKAPGADPSLARDGHSSASGLLTPLPSHLSRSPSVSSQVSSQTSIGSSTEQSWMKVDIYNGILQKKEGWYSAKKPKDFKSPRIGTATVHTINTSRLPTQEMLDHAAITPGPLKAAETSIRNRFLEKVSAVSDLHLKNHVDSTTPSLNFDFIEKYVFRNGIMPAALGFYEGCPRPCRPDMGSHCGCEYTASCGCLEFAGVDEDALKRKDPSAYQEYKRQLDSGEVPDTRGLPKRFPYRKANNNVPSTLQPFYRENRHAIYECNHNCNCGRICKSRLVQKGRQVGLTIFKTDNHRGWGVYCNEDLEKGEFIDTYLGEVITNEEAARRESEDSKDKASYLYSLDKFVGDQEGLTAETCHVVDGQYMGGPTRFINHSCEPNCRQYTVSYNKHDLWIYDLAFFAYTEIPAGTELTFDYMDKDEEEEEDVLRRREEAADDPENFDKKPCNCGAAKCRGYLWV